MKLLLSLILVTSTFLSFGQDSDPSWSFTFPDENTVKVSDISMLPKKIDTNFIKGHLNPASFVENKVPMNMQLKTFEKLKEKNVYRLKVMIMPKDPSTEEVLQWKGYRYYILTVTKKGRSFIEYVGTEI